MIDSHPPTRRTHRTAAPAQPGPREQARRGRARRRLSSAALALLAAGALFAGLRLASAAGAKPDRSSSRAAGAPAASSLTPGPGGWVEVEYGSIVDRRRLSHSGESVGMLLERLGGRPAPRPGERPEDLVAHVLLDPLLEPYAFVLPDAVDTLGPAPSAPLVEVGSLWQPGEAQPAWAELLRARRYLVESDGAGRVRLFLPWPESPAGAPPEGSAPPAVQSEEAAQQAFRAAWPVLRHVFAAEKRRLSGEGGRTRGPARDPGKGAAPSAGPSLECEVYAYRHFPARTLFELGARPFRTKVDDTRGRGALPPVDLPAWQAFLARGLRFEGGRLDPDGTIRLLGSETATRPVLLGRPLALADFAVAYRAVFHGGLGEPYMSLDRGGAPQTSLVNYGGRLQDTTLGLVSLLCDIRFKTFSLGIDVVTGRDLRESLRRELPSFRTHQERFASDRRSAGVLTQQTRLWFYPDSVDLTLSPQNDVLVLRRPRMSAASERIQQEPQAAGRAPDPPWTEETVAAINRDYDRLDRVFPELADLDQVVRLLSFFTWLKEAGARGMALPDLDVLLALELPAQPTPRRFPQLLAYNVLPPSGEPGEAQVFNRVSVGEALDALQARTGQPLPASRRFRRALAALDRRQGDHAALAQELEGYNLATLDDSSLDLLAYRAERLRMHQLVLNTLPSAQEQEVERRREKVPGLRTISVGIGGLDLGMSQALARAEGRNEKLQVGAGGAPDQGGAGEGAAGQGGERSGEAHGRGAEGSGDVPGAGAERAAAGGPASPGAGDPWPDPPLLPAIALPPQAPGAGEGGRSWTVTGAGGKGPDAVSWIQWVTGAEGPEPRSRRLIAGGRGSRQTLERLEEGRFLRYRLAAEGSVLAVVPAPDGLPLALAAQVSGPQARPGAGAPEGSAQGAELPQELATMEVQLQGAGEGPVAGMTTAPSPGAPAGGPEPAVRLQVRGAGGRELGAVFPRPVLQRLVLGRGADLVPDKPLPGLSPATKVLGGAGHLMVMMDAAAAAPPWDAPPVDRAGEEDPVRIAAALGAWWASEAPGTPAPSVVVGTDGARSVERWRTGGAAPGKAVLLLPEDGFPGASRALREAIAAAWKGGAVVSAPPAGTGSPLVLLVSAEDPALFGARLRALARDPAMKGKLLAAWPLGGPVRADLPASLLAEGNLAALGLAEYSPLGPGRVAEGIGAYASALTPPGAAGRRPEDVAGPFVWYY